LLGQPSSKNAKGSIVSNWSGMKFGRIVTSKYTSVDGVDFRFGITVSS